MNRIYVIGDGRINNELASLLSPNAEITNKLDDSVDLIFESDNFPKELKFQNIKFIDKCISKPIPVLSTSLCIPVSEQCQVSKYPERLIGIGLYPTFSEAGLIEIAPSKITDKKILENAEKILSSLKLQCCFVPDHPGLVFPRILGMIINEAAQLYSEKIASREDIDTAMKLGTNYPYGPLEWADRIGIELIYNILTSLQEYFKDERYKPHPSLLKAPPRGG